jgi:hypothetical protein
MTYRFIIAAGLLMVLGSCTKYLEAVPNSGLTVPRTAADFEQVLENEVMILNTPVLGEFSADDFYMPDAVLASQNVQLRNSFIWAKDIYEGGAASGWANMYNKIYNANIVLEGLERQSAQGAVVARANEIKSWALFCRAQALHDLAQVFAQPYKPQSADQDLGLPLKLSTNLTEFATRATVAQTYNQIVTDLLSSIPELPDNMTKSHRNRPCKAAGYALLARVYLNMQNYKLALDAAEKSLKLYAVLLDYNLANTASALPFSPLTDEVILVSTQVTYSNRTWQVDRQLYNSFDNNDLRKTLFFTFNAAANTILFKGYYGDIYGGFSGLATPEQYLIKAECLARLNQPEAALNALNILLLNRYKKQTYVNYTTEHTAEVLKLILTERRKETIFRNLRWSDLRRLNQDDQFAVTINRTVNGLNYQLLPNSVRYTFPIPDDEIRAGGMQQNPR